MNTSTLCKRELVGIDAGASLERTAVPMCEEHLGALLVANGSKPPEVVVDGDGGVTGMLPCYRAAAR